MKTDNEEKRNSEKQKDAEAQKKISIPQIFHVAEDFRNWIRCIMDNKDAILRKLRIINLTVSLFMVVVFSLFAIISLWNRYMEVFPFTVLIAVTVVYAAIVIARIVITSILKTKRSREHKIGLKRADHILRIIFKFVGLGIAVTAFVLIAQNGFTDKSTGYIISSFVLMFFSVISILLTLGSAIIRFLWRFTFSGIAWTEKPKKYGEWLDVWVKELNEKNRNAGFWKRIAGNARIRNIRRKTQEIDLALGDCNLKELSRDKVDAFLQEIPEKDRKFTYQIIEDSIVAAVEAHHIEKNPLTEETVETVESPRKKRRFWKKRGETDETMS